jgi:hypothetical protein
MVFSGTRIVHRHCEEQSDEAIQLASPARKLDCFASLAMTAIGTFRTILEMLYIGCQRMSC